MTNLRTHRPPRLSSSTLTTVTLESQRYVLRPRQRSLYVLPRILTHLVVSWLVPPKQPRSSQSLMISNANHDFSQAHDPNSLPNRASLLARTRASRHVLRRLVVLSTLTYPFPRSRLAHPFLQTYRAASISVPMDVYGIRFRDHWAVTV